MPKQTLAEAELRRLARLGAIARLKEIEAEAAAIRSAFRGLAGVQPATGRAPGKPARRRRHMSPAAREAARERMREYWAKKKAQAASAAPENGEAARATDTPAPRPRKARASKGRRGKKAR